eukprot:m.263347 g.263347  ORF g.263347 m.263347 type:complete len:503 (+) comp26885_c0_seq1:88-1596(+)
MRSACVLLVCLAALAAAEWAIVSKNLVTIDAGIAFVDENTGFTAGDANGQGPEILKTLDGGKTWNTCPAKLGPVNIFLAAAASEKDVIITSVFGELYSDDLGEHFGHTVGGGTSQSARYVGKDGEGHIFGVAGQFGTTQGVAITNDGGKTLKHYDANLFTFARYADYPTNDIWYCAAGEFPQAPPPPPPPGFPKLTNPKRVNYTRPIKSEFQNADGSFPRSYTPPTKPQTDGYAAQITKTTDGGQTWKTVFAENGTFYFNEISCRPNNPDHCCAVGEASGSAEAGARIYCTEDGGSSWNRTYWAPANSTHGYSLMQVRFVSDTDVWAAGGELNAFAPSAWFLHSTDGGRTWSFHQKPILGYLVLAMDFIGTTGYAAMDNPITQESSIAKYYVGPAPPPPPPPPPPGQYHYEDPNAGPCQTGEEAVQITGISGKFCSPGCSSSAPCPTDLPPNTTATPKCVLEAPGHDTPTNCALICTPGGTGCPEKASCKAISGTGLCTYDS